MPATLDLLAVRRFTDDLNERLRQCDNGEGMFCSNLSATIDHYVQLCGELRAYVNHWARAIFTGQTAFDQAVEDLLKEEARRLLHRSKRLAAQGRAMDGMCYVLPGLNPLHCHLADLGYLLENWVSPRLSVSPAPRVRLSHAAEQQVMERIGKLSALPADWRPNDPEQRALFPRQREK
ncbi:MAG TPA: hypothetical protein DDY78_20515 [Planctomycetales bacterium]|jgi:hypothetical protein|nr:hypothetical protein [Planctomycetales bacterium]